MNYQAAIDFIRSLYPGQDFIPLHEPHFFGNEKKYLTECIDTNFVSSVGKFVDRFEEIVRDYTSSKYAVATVNGTAALHIALLLAGVKRGDLVITQPLTFIATCNAINYCGADPVFVDIDRNSLGLSAAALEKWLSENASVEKSLDGLELRSLDGLEAQPSQLSKLSSPELICLHKETKRRISACLPMHTFGHPCEIVRIVDICNKYHIPVVEDAAESIGSFYKNKHTGTFGLLGILSFNGNKTITTGGGGMIITNEENLGKLAKHLTTQAKVPHPWNFEHDMIGYNYRLPNINAALGCAQMDLLPEIIRNKRDTAKAYHDFFKNKKEIEFFTELENCSSNYWLNVIFLQDQVERDEFLKQTNESKVMTRPAWILMNQLSMFKGAISGRLHSAKDIAARLVNIPSSVRK